MSLNTSLAVGVGAFAAQYFLTPRIGMFGSSNDIPVQQYAMNAGTAAVSDAVAAQLLGTSGLTRALGTGALYAVVTNPGSTNYALASGGIVALIDLAAQQIF
jgi:hypothetical protein